MDEIWIDIAEFEGRYQVSNHGRVKSVAKCWAAGKNNVCIPERIMSQQKHYRGYMFVHLRKPGLHKKYFVHRLVAMAFLPNPENKEVVNHKDRDKQYNHVINLEWATFQENSQHYVAMDKAAAAAAGPGSDIPF